MSSTEISGNSSVFKVEQHGTDPIPAAERTMGLRDIGLFWMATNLYIFNFSLGVIAYSFGLSLAATLGAALVGNLAYLLVALGSIPGVRQGVPTLVITRASFGLDFNRLNCFLSWLLGVAFEVVNIVFGTFAAVELFKLLGWRDPGAAGKIIGLLLVFGVTAAVAYLGYAAVMAVQKVFAGALFAVMAVVAAFTLPKVNWEAASSATGTSWSAWLMAAGVFAAGALAYLQIPSDYTRYMPETTSGAKVFWVVTIAAGGPALMLGAMGAVMASQGDLSDPLAGVRSFVPGWLFVLFVLVVIGGSIGNNLITLYSSAFAVQSIGVPLKRYQATMVDAVCSLALVLFVLFGGSALLDVLNSFIALVVVWIGPFGGIWLTDAVMRTFRYSPESLHGDANRTGPQINWRGAVALLVGAAAAAATMSAPVFHGPLSDLLADGGDLSWLVGPLVGGLCYFALNKATRS